MLLITKPHTENYNVCNVNHKGICKSSKSFCSSLLGRLAVELAQQTGERGGCPVLAWQWRVDELHTPLRPARSRTRRPQVSSALLSSRGSGPLHISGPRHFVPASQPLDGPDWEWGEDGERVCEAASWTENTGISSPALTMHSFGSRPPKAQAEGFPSAVQRSCQG